MDLQRIPRLLEKCHECAKDSHDCNTQVGAILVHKKTRSVVAEGFNGHIRGVPKYLVPTSGMSKYRYMVHAEANLVFNTFRTGAIKYSPDKYALFCTDSPCENCARILHQCDIKEIYVEFIHPMFETYRLGNESANAALDIVGVAEPYYRWNDDSISDKKPIVPSFGNENPIFYKIIIGARQDG